MTGALVIVLILVGLPLFAFWLGGRRSWSRVEALHQDAMQQERDWTARHRLTHVEAAAVQRAILWGRGLDDPRLRAAVVDRVRTDSAARRVWEDRHPRSAAVVRWVSALWALLLLTAVVFSVAFGEWSALLSLYLAGTAVSVGFDLVRRRNVQRAVELNSPPGD